MHRKKDEIRDIYQGHNHDFEKDFTPQVAQEQRETRRRDLRRSRIISIVFGVLAVVLVIVLAYVVIHDFLSERIPSKKASAAAKPYIPKYSLSSDSVWVMDYEPAASQTDVHEKPGPKPLSSKWVKNAAYHTILGQQALSLNHSEEALEHFQKVIDIFPDIAGLRQTMGLLCLQRNDFATAATHLEKAFQEDASFDTANNLGAAYIGLNEYDKAEKFLKKALELRPESPGCHKNLAVLYRKMKLDSKAIYHFEKYLDLNPGDLDSMQTYALYLTELGRWKDAATFLTKLTQEVTDVAPIYFLLAQVQVQNGQQDKALAALKRGVQLVDPEMAMAWMSNKEFNDLRNSGGFKSLVDQLKAEPGTLEKTK